MTARNVIAHWLASQEDRPLNDDFDYDDADGLISHLATHGYRIFGPANEEDDQW